MAIILGYFHWTLGYPWGMINNYPPSSPQSMESGPYSSLLLWATWLSRQFQATSALGSVGVGSGPASDTSAMAVRRGRGLSETVPGRGSGIWEFGGSGDFHEGFEVEFGGVIRGWKARPFSLCSTQTEQLKSWCCRGLKNQRYSVPYS